MSTWTLTETEVQRTRERAAKINKRLTRRGFTGLVEMSVGEPRPVDDVLEGGVHVTTIMRDVTLTGRPAQYAGWTFVAAVDTVSTSDGHDYIVRCAPGMDITAAERATLEPFACQHCHTTRTNRVHSYLLRNAASGEVIQVGKSCMADFLGCPVVPSMLPTGNDIEDDLRDAFNTGGPDMFTPETVVAVALALVDAEGYISRDAAADRRCQSTADTVRDVLYGPADQRKELLSAYPALAALDTDRARTVIGALTAAASSDGYLANLRATLSADVIGYKHIGIAASAPVAYRRMTEREQERAEREAAKSHLTYLGKKGEKVEVTGTITRRQYVPTQYGSSLLLIVDAGQHLIKVFTSAKWAIDVEQGQDVTLVGTVKAHEEYQGAKQTMLTRAKLVA